MIIPPRTDDPNELRRFHEQLCLNVNDLIPYGSTNNDVDLAWYGFSPNATAAANDIYFAKAVSSMVSGQRLIIPPGTYEIENVVFNPPNGCSLLAYGGLESAATGTAFTIGDGTGSTYVMRYNIQNLKVVSSSTDHTAGRVGVLIYNVYESYIDIRSAEGFETGIKCQGFGAGVSYNEIHLGHIYNNKYSTHLYASDSGWVNENNFYGGRFGWSSSQDTAGFRHIWIDHYATNNINNNKFFAPSLESAVSTGTHTAIALYCEGVYNYFYSPRWEMDSNNELIEFTSNSHSNAVYFGYDLASAQARVTDDGTYNKIFTRNNIRINGASLSSDNGVMQFKNAGTETSAPVVSIHGTDDTVNAKIFGDGSYEGLDYNVGGTKVVGVQQTGVSAMTNLTAPVNLDADTVTVAEVADIVGNLINKLRSHGLVAN